MEGSVRRRVCALSILTFVLAGVSQTGSAAGDRTVLAKLPESAAVRYLKDGVLEYSVDLPANAVIEIPRDAAPDNYPYRDGQGDLQFTTNFYYGGVRIVSVSARDLGAFPPERIEQLNSTPGGLFVSNSVVDDLLDEGTIPPLQRSEPSEDFLKTYSPEGRPNFNYTQTFTARFGDQLNLVIDPATQSAEEREKWSAIYQELKKVGDRTQPLDSSYLFMPVEDAINNSVLYEEQGIVQKAGAWSIAVKGTAVRHGFPNVPCAEFQSELIRQAYQRAGYSHFDDFGDSAGNPLIWTSSAAVVNLATALYKAGWIPWEAAKYRPLIGAIIMNEKATTPGHTYMAAGEDGRFIMDNGSPRGRDLRTTSDRIISMMYRSGVFFLPPGIIPQKW